MEYILYFFVYGCIGWICETIYCSIWERKFVNRGFLYGPICPVYGVGALFIIFLLRDVSNNIFLLFLLGAIVTSIVEYVTGFLLEALFNAKWWDYSNRKFNINGRVCLFNSILFGIMSVILLKIVHPYIKRIVIEVPNNLLYILVTMIIIIFLVDLVLTVLNVFKLNGKLQKLIEVKSELEAINIKPKKFAFEELEKLFNDIKKKNKSKNIKDKIERISIKLEDIKKKSKYQRRILKAFPNMKHKNNYELLQNLRQLLREQKKSSKKTSKRNNKRSE